ncbi:hypothetical protein [Streptomyces olivaceoviridis]|uniref:hypothetical protein n=1 Tax=Streptomyces olivaceoviridis TaxID=1921 RepID=UPI0036F9225F
MAFAIPASPFTGGWVNQDNRICNLPMRQPSADRADFWDNYVAADTRGYIPGSAMPNGGATGVPDSGADACRNQLVACLADEVVE